MGIEMLYYALVMLVVSAVITSAMMPSPQSRDPSKLEDFQFPQIDEGTPQAVVFGDCWCNDWTILALGDFRTVPIPNSSGGGGKK